MFKIIESILENKWTYEEIKEGTLIKGKYLNLLVQILKSSDGKSKYKLSIINKKSFLALDGNCLKNTEAESYDVLCYFPKNKKLKTFMTQMSLDLKPENIEKYIRIKKFYGAQLFLNGIQKTNVNYTLNKNFEIIEKVAIFKVQTNENTLKIIQKVQTELSKTEEISYIFKGVFVPKELTWHHGLDGNKNNVQYVYYVSPIYPSTKHEMLEWLSYFKSD